MIETSTIAAALPPAAIEPVLRTTPPRTPQAGIDPPLDPAVTLDLSPDARRAVANDAAPAETPETKADRAHYRRDPDSKQIVFQVVGSDGSVVEQLPSEAILRARTYAREAEAARSTEIGTSVARSA
ncbi:flagellar protein FlaG [Methylobacterium sp. Gmos1]